MLNVCLKIMQFFLLNKGINKCIQCKVNIIIIVVAIEDDPGLLLLLLL